MEKTMRKNKLSNTPYSLIKSKMTLAYLINSKFHFQIHEVLFSNFPIGRQAFPYLYDYASSIGRGGLCGKKDPSHAHNVSLVFHLS